MANTICTQPSSSSLRLKLESSVTAVAPTVLSRLDRVDMMLGYLEDGRGTVRMRSSCASMTSSGSVDDFSPKRKGFDRRSCRTIEDAVAEVQLKGSVLERVDNLESRLIKLEEEMEREKLREEEEEVSSPSSSEKMKIGLKRLVKSCVKVKTKE